MADVRGCTCQLFWFELHERIGRAINILWLAEPAIRLILFGAQTSFQKKKTETLDVCAATTSHTYTHKMISLFCYRRTFPVHICDSVNRISAISGENTEKKRHQHFCIAIGFRIGMDVERSTWSPMCRTFLVFHSSLIFTPCLYVYGWCDCYASYIRPSISPIANNNNRRQKSLRWYSME